VADDSEDYRLRLTSLNGLTHFADPISLRRDPEFHERIQQVRDKSTSMQLRDAADRYLKHSK
jgi:hypothetical protein